VQIIQYLFFCSTIQIYAVWVCFYSYSYLKYFYFIDGMAYVTN